MTPRRHCVVQRPLGLRILRLEDRLTPSTTIPLNATSWTPIGSAAMGTSFPSAGRTTSVAAHPTDANTIYIGTASGGVWKTTNATNSNPTWTPLTDFQAALTTGDVALAPTDPNIIYVGTGEPNNSGDSFYGRGVLKSSDAGSTWSLFTNGGLFDRKTMSRVRVHPTDPNIVFVAVQGSGVNGLGGNNGIYRSTNGGTTWTNTTTAITTTAAFNDLEIDPNNPNTAYCTIGSSGGNSANGIYKTTNLLGTSPTWTLLSGTTTGTSNGRTLIAMAPSNSLFLYVSIIATSGGGLAKFYQSTDGGATWIDNTSTTPNYPSPQGSYDTSLAVDPSDPNIVVAGGASGTSRLIRTTNGGLSWTSILGGAGNRPHVDHHNLGFDAQGRILDVGDGGIYRLNTLSPINWSSLNGISSGATPTALQTGQFVGIAIHPTNPNLALGGLQDNGTQRFNDNLAWPSVDGGDGGDLVYDPFNPNTIYRVSPVGSFGATAFMRRSTNGGTSFSSITAGIVNAANAQFYPPITVDPATSGRIFLGTNVVNVSLNGGTGWAQLGAVLPTTSSIAALAIGAASTQTLYVAANNNAVYVTTDNGATWNNRTPAGDSWSDFAIDPTNSNIAYVVSGSFNGSARVFRTTNAGQSWTNITGNLPNVPANALQFDPGPTSSSTDDTLYLGNDQGVYSSTNFAGSGTVSWTRFGTSLPNVIVTDLELASATSILAAGTYGRGVWEILTQPAAIPNQSINGTQFLDSNNNGAKDPGEPGQSNWTVFIDNNNNGEFDAALSGPTNFPSTNVPVAIPDLGSGSSTITIPAGAMNGVVTNITLTLSITHTAIGDTLGTLTSPSGQSINLFTNVGGNNPNMQVTTFDDTAAVSINTGAAPFNGSFRPAQALATLNGVDPTGVWTLRIDDVFSQDSGTINSWSLRITTGENSRLTNSLGEYQFANLAPGDYVVRNVLQAGFFRTLPVPPADSYSVTIAAGQAGVTGRDFGVTTDATPPAVSTVVIGDGTLQRSFITQLQVSFSEVIQYVGAPTAAFALLGPLGAVPLSVSTTIVGTQTQVTLIPQTSTTFGSLDDGRYTLTVNANQIRDFAGNLMTTNSVTSFHRFYGDANNDARIDIADFGFFSGTYNQSIGQPGFLPYMDFNADNRIDIADFGQFSIRYFTSLP